MKSFKQHIFEKLKVSKHTLTLFPKTKEELLKMITDEISKNGNECSLNHIDVSRITDMSQLFFTSKFNQNIDNWKPKQRALRRNMFKDSPLENNLPIWYKE